MAYRQSNLTTFTLSGKTLEKVRLSIGKEPNSVLILVRYAGSLTLGVPCQVSAVHCECLLIVGSDENDTQIVNAIFTFLEVLTFVRSALWSISRRNPCLRELFGKMIFQISKPLQTLN